MSENKLFDALKNRENPNSLIMCQVCITFSVVEKHLRFWKVYHRIHALVIRKHTLVGKISGIFVNNILFCGGKNTYVSGKFALKYILQ